MPDSGAQRDAPAMFCIWRRPTTWQRLITRAYGQGEERAGSGAGQSLKGEVCSDGGTHHGPGVRSGVWLARCPSRREQLLQFLHVYTFLVSAQLATLSLSSPIQSQDARVSLALGALRRGQLVFYILTEEDPKG